MFRLICFCLLFLYPNHVFAEIGVKQLEEIHLEINEQKIKLAKLTKARGDSEIKLNLLKTEAKELNLQYTRLGDKLIEINERALKVGAELQQIELQTASLVKVARLRWGALYKYMDHGIRAETLKDVEALYYMSKLRRYDTELLEKLERMNQRKLIRVESLEKLRLEQSKLASETKLRKRVLDSKLEEQSKLLKNLELREAEIDEGILRLKAKALRFETVLASLTGGEIHEIKNKLNSADSNSLKSKQTSDKSRVRMKTGGDGLNPPLSYPTNGELITRFGKRVSEAINEPIFNKGVDFKAKSGAEVVSVDSGVIGYIGRLPGFGSVVIVDHGGRDYTLYGRLAVTVVKLGDTISSAGLLGYVGDPGVSGKNLYFEVRRSGVVIDPLTMIKR